MTVEKHTMLLKDEMAKNFIIFSGAIKLLLHQNQDRWNLKEHQQQGQLLDLRLLLRKQDQTQEASVYHQQQKKLSEAQAMPLKQLKLKN